MTPLHALNASPTVAYLFDVDGVLTEPETKRVEHEAIFDELLRRLTLGLPIGLNTGRSLEFVVEKIVLPLRARAGDARLLQNLYAVGEKGASWIIHDERGAGIEKTDTSVSVPPIIQEQIRLLIQRRDYSMMFFDETKRTMVSVELRPTEQRPGVSLKDFHRVQKHLVEDLTAIIARHGLENTLRVDPTRIATDVENVHVGKALGARKFLELLEARAIRPRRYVAFGDSPSDYEMYGELVRNDREAAFIFVGNRESIADKPQEGVLYTATSVDEGTLEFLRGESF